MNLTLLLNVLSGVAAIIASGQAGGQQDQKHANLALTILQTLLGLHPAAAAAMTTASPGVIGSPAAPASVNAQSVAQQASGQS